MKRIIVGVVIIVAVGIFAFSMYNRTGAEAPLSSTAVEAQKACPGTCSSTCTSAACLDKSTACPGCPSAKTASAATGTCPGQGTCKGHPECASKGECTGHPDCTCQGKCTGHADCTCAGCVKARAAGSGAVQKQAKSTCGSQCPGTCAKSKASGT